MIDPEKWVALAQGDGGDPTRAWLAGVWHIAGDRMATDGRRLHMIAALPSEVLTAPKETVRVPPLPPEWATMHPPEYRQLFPEGPGIYLNHRDLRALRAFVSKAGKMDPTHVRGGAYRVFLSGERASLCVYACARTDEVRSKTQIDPPLYKPGALVGSVGAPLPGLIKAICIDARFLSDALQPGTGQGASIRIQGEREPVSISHDDQRRALVMPVRA